MDYNLIVIFLLMELVLILAVAFVLISRKNQKSKKEYQDFLKKKNSKKL
jgi:preprotein translocase subunit YajC